MRRRSFWGSYKLPGEVIVDPVAKESLTYNKTQQELVTEGEGTGTMLYNVNGGAWSSNIPTAMNAGEYTVGYKAAESDGYAESESGTVIVNISQVHPIIVKAPTAKTGLTYNGSAQTLVESGSTNFGNLVYSLDNSNYSAVLPKGINATSYTVYYKVEADSNVYGTEPEQVTGITINKANPAYIAPTAKTGLTYDSSDKGLLNSGSTSDGEIQYSSNGSSWSTVIPTGTDAGEYDSYWRLIGDSNHNNVSSTTLTTTIGKANGRVDIAPAAITGLVYSGSAQELVTSGSGTGQMQYKLDNGSWGSSIPTAINATSYTVYYKAAESANYKESNSGSVGVSIAKVTPTVVPPTPKDNLVYNESAQTLANSGTTNFGTLKYSLTSGGVYSTNVPSGTDATSYTVYYKVEGNSNVYDVPASSVTCSIAQATPDVIAPTAKTGLTFNDSAQELLNSGSTSGGEIQYSSDNINWGAEIPTGIAADTYTSYWRLSGGTNYKSIESTPIVTTIYEGTPVKITIILDTDVYTYDGTAKEPTPIVKVDTTVISGSEYTVSYSNNVSAGTATCIITDKPGGNYVVNGSKTFTINKVTPTVVPPTPKTGLTYNRSSQVLANSGATNFGELKYSLDNITYSANVPSATNAGDYNVYYKVVGDDNVNDVPSAGTPPHITCSIAPAVVDNPTITLSTTAYTYDGTAKEPTPTVKDGSYTIPSSCYTVSYSDNVNVGTGTCTITDVEGGNYTISGSKTFTINPSAITGVTVELNESAFTYNNTVQKPSVTVKSGSKVLTANTHYTLTWSNSSSKNVGSYTVTVKPTSNYSFTNVSKTYEINCYNATAPTAKLGLVYSASAQTLVNAGSVLYGATIQYKLGSVAWSTTVPTATDAGPYTVSWKVTGNDNSCDTAATDISVTIAKATPAITVIPSAKSGLVYNGQPQELLSGGTANVPGDFTYSVGTNASSYTATWTFTPTDKNNYKTVSGEVSASIGKADCSVVVSKTTNTYDGTAFVLASVNGACGTMHYKVGASGTWSINIPTATNAGEYKVYWYMDGADNYNAIASSSTRYVTSTINCSTNYTVIAPKAKTGLKYTGSAQELLSGGSATVGGSFTYGTGTDADDYDATWTYTPTSSNYCSKSGTVAASIAKGDCPVTVNGVTKTYTGTAFELVTVSGACGTMHYKVGTSGTWSINIPTATNADEYNVYWYMDGTNNYNAIASSSTRYVTSTINCSSDYEITTVPGAKTGLKYTGQSQELLSGGSSTIAGSFTYGTGIDVDDYNATWTFNPTSSNYCSKSGTVAASIAKGDCPVTVNGVTKTYTGTAFELVSGGTMCGTMHYKVGTGGTWSINIPTATSAGEYKVYWYMDGTDNWNAIASSSTRYVTSTINCSSDYTVIVPKAKTGLKYTGKSQELLSGGSSTIAGSFTYGTGIDADDYDATWTYTPTSSNYCSKSGTVAASIAKGDCPVTVSGVTETYNEASHALATVSGACGTMHYRLSGETTWVDSTPTATECGDYNVYWKMDGTNNYNAIASSSTRYVSSTIATNSSYTFTAPTAKTGLVYNGSLQQLFDAGTSSVLGDWTYGSGINAGTYSSASWTFEPDDSCYATKTGTASVTISPKPVSSPTITLSPSTFTYNGSAKTPTSVTVYDGDNLIPSSEYTVSYSNNVSAGTATCTITDKTGGNYTVSGSKTFTINPSAITGVTVELNESAFTYNNTVQTPDVTVKSGSKVLTANTHYTLAWSNSSSKNVGSYTVTVSPTSNYSFTNVTKTYEINCYNATAPTAKSNLVYSASAQTLVNAGSVLYGATIQYKLGGGAWSTTVPTATDAGPYTVSWKVTGNDNCCNTAATDISVTIDKAKGLVTTAPVPIKNLEYTSSAQALVTPGQGTGKMLYSLTENGTYTETIPSGTNAGDYTVYYKAAESANYYESDTASTDTITISAQPIPGIDVTVSPTSFTYNNTVQKPSVTVKSGNRTLTSGTHYTLSWSNNSSKNVGTYTVTVKPTSNYSFTNVAKTYKINCYDATAPKAKTNLVYSASAQTLVSGGSVLYGAVIQYKLGSGAWSNTVPTATDASGYTVYWKVTGNDNCCDTAETAISVTIDKAPGQVTTVPVPIENLTYNGSSKSLTTAGSGTGVMQYSYNEVNWYTTILTGKNAGDYEVFYKAAESANYTESNVYSTTAHIGPQSIGSIKVELSSSAFTYNGDYQRPSVTVKTTSSSALTEGVHYVLIWSNFGSRDASRYTVTVSAKSNYDFTAVKNEYIISCYHATAPTAKTGLVYNGNAKELVNAGSTITGSTMEYSTNNSYYSTSIPSGTAAGSYTVYWRITGNAVSNICTTGGSVSVSIASQQLDNVTASLSFTSTEYNGSGQTPVVTVKRNGTTISTAYYNLSWQNSNSTNVGSYTVTVKPKPNYYFDNIVKTYNITCYNATGPTAVTGLIYNGSSQTLIESGYTKFGTFYYSLDNTLWSDALPKRTNAGVHTVYWKVDGNDNVCNTAASTVSVTIMSKVVSSPTITLSPSTFTYNGSAQTPSSVTVYDGSTIIPSSCYTVSYSNNIDAGTGAKCTIADKLGGNYAVSGSKTFTIYKKQLTNMEISVDPTGFTYNNTVKKPTVTVTSKGSRLTENNEYSLSWSNINSKNVGNYSVSAIATSNYSFTTLVSGYSISCYSVKIKPTAITGLTHNGSAQALVNAGTTDYGTIKYSLDDSVYKTSVPTATAAGTYTVYWKVFDNDNVCESTGETIAVTISQSAITNVAITLSETDFIYNNAVQTPSVTVKNGSTVLTEGTHYTLSWQNSSSKTVGTYKVSASPTPDFSFNTVSASYTISCYTATRPSAIDNLSYDGTSKALVSSTTQPYNAVNIYKVGSGSWSSTVPSGTTAGNYSISWATSGNTNVCPSTAQASTISAYIAPMQIAGVQASLSSSEFTYNGSIQRPTVTVTASGGGTLIENNHYTLVWRDYNSSDAGDYTVTVQHTSNYSFDNITLAYTINCSSVTSPKAKTGLTYNPDLYQPLLNAGSTTYGTMQYSSNGTSWGSVVPTGLNAGTYTSYWRITGVTSSNICSTGGTITTTIAAKTVSSPTITLSPSTFTYNGSAKTPTSVTVYDGDNLIPSSEYTVSYSNNIHVSAAAKCTISDKTGGNYTVSGSKTFTINPSAITNVTITASPTAFTYNKTVQKPSTVTVKSGTNTLTSGTHYTLSWQDSSSENIGVYEITATPGADYSFTNVTTNYRITCYNATAPTAKTGLTYNPDLYQPLLNAGSALYGGTLQYKLSTDSSWGNLIPTAKNAGTYTVNWKVTGNTNCCDTGSSNISVTIDRLELNNVTISVSPSAFTYNSSVQRPTVTVKNGTTTLTEGVHYTLNWSDYNSTDAESSYWVEAYPTPNYDFDPVEAYYSINCYSATAPKAKTGLVYNGSAQTLVSGGSTSYGKIMYSLSQNGTYSSGVPTATSASTYNVWWKVTGNENVCQYGADPQKINVTISPSAFTNASITLIESAFTYNNAVQKPTVIVRSGGYALVEGTHYTLSWSNSSSKDVGTYSVTANPTSNYSCMVLLSKSYVINCYSATAPTGKILTYNPDFYQPLLNAGSTTYGTMQYSSNGTSWGSIVPTGRNAGTYNLYWKVTGNTNVCDTGATSVSAYIGPKLVANPTITLSTTEYTYDGTAKTPTPTVKDGSTTIPSSEYTVSYSNNIDAGTATCTITDKTGGNYTVDGSQTFTINKQPLGSVTVSFDSNAFTYNNSVQKPTVTVKNGSTTLAENTHYTLSWSDSNSKNIGSYNVVVSPTSNYSFASITKTYAISCYSATAPTARAGLKYVGSSQPLLGAGSTSYGTMVYSSNGTSWSQIVPTATDAGSYTVYWKVTGNTNVCDTGASSISVSIAKAAGSVTTAPTAKSLTYNGSAQTLVNAGEGTGTMQYSLDNSTWGTRIPSGTDASAYTVYYKASASTNYNESSVSSVTASISVYPLTDIEVLLSDTKFTYNGSVRVPMVRVENGTTTLTAGTHYTLTWQDSSSTNVGTYKITAKPAKNYDFEPVIASYKINCYTATAPTAKTGLTYNGSSQTLVNAGSSDFGEFAYSLDNTLWSGALPKRTDAGSYTVYWKLIGDAVSNVCTTAGTVSVTISEYPLNFVTVELSSTAYTYNNTVQKPTVTVMDGSTTLTDGTHYTLTWENSSSTNVGIYKITVKPAANYDFDPVVESYRINCYRATTPTAKTGLTFSPGVIMPLINAGSTSFGTMEYKMSTGSTWYTENQILSHITGSSAGSYTTDWRITGNTNVCTTAGTVTATISPKTLTNPTITLSTTAYTYDGTAKTPTPTVKDTSQPINPYTIPSSEYTVSYSNNTNAGTATCTITDVEGGNYTVSGSKNFTINKKTCGITISGVNIHNDGNEHSLVSIAGVVGGIPYFRVGTSGMWSSDQPQASAEGTYTIYYYVKSTNSNYSDYGSTGSPYSVTSTIDKHWSDYLSATEYEQGSQNPQKTVRITVKPSIIALNATSSITSFTPAYDIVIVATANNDSTAQTENKYVTVGVYYAGHTYTLTKDSYNYYLPEVNKRRSVPTTWLDGESYIEVSAIVPELTSGLYDGAVIGSTNLGTAYLDGDAGITLYTTGLMRNNNSHVIGFFEECGAPIDGTSVYDCAYMFDIE